MTQILVLVDIVDGAASRVTAELLTAAASLGQPVAAVLGPTGSFDAVAAKLADFGAVSAYVAEGGDIAEHGAGPKAEILANIVGQLSPAAVLIASTVEGKEIAARLAVRLGSGIITDATEIRGDAASGIVATQSVFGGSSVVHSMVSTGVPVITVRVGAISAQPSLAATKRVDVTVDLPPALVTTVERRYATRSARPALVEAAMVVSGGRGTNGDFGPVEALADALGEAVGASRAATDAGCIRTSFRLARLARRCRQSCTLRPEIPSRSNTVLVCKPRRPSSSSTKTPSAALRNRRFRRRRRPSYCPRSSNRRTHETKGLMARDTLHRRRHCWPTGEGFRPRSD